MYGGGGICDDIAEAMCNVIHNKTEYNCFTLYNEYDYHTSMHVYDIGQKLIFNVDIPPNCYETGAGYTWKKKPNIRFNTWMVVIDPEDWDNYFDEDDELMALNENVTKDKDFNYLGYECRIPFMERFNSYGCAIYKDGEYKLGMRGPVGSLDKARKVVKESVDGIIAKEKSGL